MNLAAVGSKDLNRWYQHPTSALSEHEGACCRHARSWFLAQARSFDPRLTENQTEAGPRFLSVKYKWGPNPWPLHWCEVVARDTIDCGVFAALAKEIFRGKGIQAFNGQIIEQASPDLTSHYKALWRGQTGTFEWIGDAHLYHEVVIIRASDFSARVYDPTEGLWLLPERVGGIGSPIAIRSEAPVALYWGEHSLFPDQWTELT